MKLIEFTLSLDGFAAPIEVCAVYTHSTYGGVCHYQVGVGTAGQLLAVYGAVEHRGIAAVRECLGGDADAPAEVVHAVAHELRNVFHSEWVS